MQSPEKIQELEDLLDRVSELVGATIDIPKGVILTFVCADVHGFVIRSNGCEDCAEKMLIMVADQLMASAERDAVEAVDHLTVQ